jgi:UDP-2,4-diacetamido-2,4,6-trideoxy-beta-L-altropyranose hydrolase
MTTSVKTILIRADADSQIGTGHVMRCLALAQAWRERGGRVIFLMKRNLPALTDRIKKEGFGHRAIPASARNNVDAAFTIAEAKRGEAQWVVVDGYHFDWVYRKTLKNSGLRVLWVDDLGTSGFCFADIIVNQNIYARKNMYPKCSLRTHLLLGPRYALLRKEFANSPTRLPKGSHCKRVLISGGGTDPHNITKIALESLSNFSAHPLNIEVILGPGYKKEGTIAKFKHSKGIHRIHFIRNPTRMAGHMVRADLAIIAAGSTCWEIARQGVPALLIVQADNQINVACFMHRAGVAWNLGHAREVTAAQIEDRFKWLTESPSIRKRMGWKGRRLTDGRGAKRVAEFLKETLPPVPVLHLRRARPFDCLRLWRWANDPAARASSFSTKRIPWDIHQAWFKERLNSGKYALYIATNGHGRPIGSVRLEPKDRKQVISVIIEKSHRGQGFGALLIRMAARKLIEEGYGGALHAFIKPSNLQSLQAFCQAGFRQIGKKRMAGAMAVHCIFTRADPS